MLRRASIKRRSLRLRGGLRRCAGYDARLIFHLILNRLSSDLASPFRSLPVSQVYSR